MPLDDGCERPPHIIRQAYVAGRVAEEEDLEILTSGLGLDDFIRFLSRPKEVGAISRNAADVLAAGARSGALPLNVLGAHSAGLPVVASDVPAHYEAIMPEPREALVRVDTPEALGGTLVALAANRERL